jgi:hypothetical protein
MDERQLTCSPSFPVPLAKFVGSAFCLHLLRYVAAAEQLKDLVQEGPTFKQTLETVHSYFRIRQGHVLCRVNKLMNFAYESF